ncbi:hypothetical protein D0T84_01600 [Dysgonomonas sp. 521]|nr:hypothetical protein [Dysgonomonas sp. 521]
MASATPPPPPKKAIAMVEFRPLPGTSYNGEFGFDWFRVGDNGERSFKNATTNMSISLTGGTTTSTTTVITPIADIQNEYKKITVLKANPPVNITDSTYYVPYLNLYTKGRANTVKNGEKPPFEAELQIKITIDEELEKVEFEYDKKWFSISFNGVVQDTLPETILTPCPKRDSSIIKISCYNEEYDGFSSNKELLAWAYPKGSVDKIDRKLVGKIRIGANDKNHRKFEKMVFIRVKTDIEGIGLGGNSNSGPRTDEEVYLRRALYQSLTFMDTELYTEELDLTDNDDFKITGSNFGKFIYERGVTPIGTMDINKTTDRWLYVDHIDFFSTLHALFIARPGNSKYNNYFTAFYFEELTYDSYITTTGGGAKTLGQVENIGVKNVCIFRDRNDWTLAHEALHGYGLHHPFSSSSKLLFIKEATDNIMDYGSAHRPFTWAWQWKIVNPKLKI